MRKLLTKDNAMTVIVLLSAVFIYFAYTAGYKHGRSSYERDLVYCIAGESACTVDNMTIIELADGRNLINFKLNAFKKEVK